MQLLMRVLLLLQLLLSCSAEDCDLPDRVQPPQLQKLLQVRWVLVEAFSDYPAGVEIVKNINSSVVELKLRDDNQTIEFVEKNVVGGKCITYRINMTAPDRQASNHTLQLANPGVLELDGVESPYDDQGRAEAYQGCPDCLLVVYSGVFEGTAGRMLLIYRAEGKHLNAEELKAAESNHLKMAECLKFDVSAHFVYDGKAEFCLEKKKEETDA
ncbi:saxitoxin and tetrodotoxin-binding protein 2-like [Parambassis ranga]|uniref:Saxitoxin and tetrodotoxin-binding protein 2-like n=1 Tax=Parambassis ranga TaxID=210632 RepID=A0A6P7K2Z2_9TELE|nr:saxitoxin and tetrodotoxin-binding protein 2-like [Parambassis ranga]